MSAQLSAGSWIKWKEGKARTEAAFEKTFFYWIPSSGYPEDSTTNVGATQRSDSRRSETHRSNTRKISDHEDQQGVTDWRLL